MLVQRNTGRSATTAGTGEGGWGTAVECLVPQENVDITRAEPITRPWDTLAAYGKLCVRQSSPIPLRGL